MRTPEPCTRTGAAGRQATDALQGAACAPGSPDCPPAGGPDGQDRASHPSRTPDRSEPRHVLPDRGGSQERQIAYRPPTLKPQQAAISVGREQRNDPHLSLLSQNRYHTYDKLSRVSEQHPARVANVSRAAGKLHVQGIADCPRRSAMLCFRPSSSCICVMDERGERGRLRMKIPQCVPNFGEGGVETPEGAGSVSAIPGAWLPKRCDQRQAAWHPVAATVAQVRRHFT
jgi:hypothetical protein